MNEQALPPEEVRRQLSKLWDRVDGMAVKVEEMAGDTKILAASFEAMTRQMETIATSGLGRCGVEEAKRVDLERRVERLEKNTADMPAIVEALGRVKWILGVLSVAMISGFATWFFRGLGT